jgi:hypothetical protein
MEIFGDCHMLLKFPSQFKGVSESKRPMKVQVTRGSQIIDARVSKLSDDGTVYAITIAREQAHNVLTVTVTVRWRGTLKETFELDFGSSWLKVASWKQAARAASSQLQAAFVQAHDNVEVATKQLSVGVLSTGSKISDAARTFSSAAETNLNRFQQLFSRGTLDVKTRTQRNVKLLSAKVSKKAESTSNAVTAWVKGSSARLSLRAKTISSIAGQEWQKAAISSKLFWLKHTQQLKEYERYKEATRAAKCSRQVRGKICHVRAKEVLKK